MAFMFVRPVEDGGLDVEKGLGASVAVVVILELVGLALAMVELDAVELEARRLAAVGFAGILAANFRS